MTLMSGSALLAEIQKGKQRLSDGAMGSVLIEQGVAPSEVLPANLRKPALVQAVHQAYLDAGAGMLTSNTFGVCDPSQWREAVLAGLDLAIETAMKARAPVGVFFSLTPDSAIREADRLFEALDRQSASEVVLLLETCVSGEQTTAAVGAIRKRWSGPLAATAHCSADGTMLDGAPFAETAVELAASGVDFIGGNCGEAGSPWVEIAAQIRDRVRTPLLFQPGAGLPELQTDGRLRYPIDPDQYASLAEDLFTAGVSIVGGCCGTTPVHLQTASSRCATLSTLF